MYKLVQASKNMSPHLGPCRDTKAVTGWLSIRVTTMITTTRHLLQRGSNSTRIVDHVGHGSNGIDLVSRIWIITPVYKSI